MKTLYKYQQEVVDRAGFSTALFWDMGLGKTVTALEIYKKYNKINMVETLFVMCPVSMVNEWVTEFESQVGKKAITYKNLEKELKKTIKTKTIDYIYIDKYIKDNEIECIVLNYDMVWRLQNYGWLNGRTMIVCDESHRIKNTTSRIGKYMKFLKVKTKFKICLTGTPQSQGYLDYYNQLYFLDKIDMTLGEFKDNYCMYDNAVFNGIKIKQLVGYKKVGEFEKIYLEKCEFLKMERVYDDIIKYNYVPISTTKEYERIKLDRVIFYDALDNIILDRKLIQQYMLGNKDTGIVEYKCLDNAGAYRYGLRKLLDSEHKHQWLHDFLEDYDKRVVIFYNYNHELDSIKKVLEKLNRKYSVYNGSEKDFTNFKQYEDGVCICNYASGSVGINDLVISNIFIAYSPTDNYLLWEQSKKRIDRNGQKNTPIYYFLESGLENRIYASLKVGKNFDDRVFISELEENLI